MGREPHYSIASRQAYCAACLVLRRAGVPYEVLRGTLALYVLERFVVRAIHPTRRLGHPLPVIATALYYATAIRADVVGRLSTRSRARLISSSTHAHLDCSAATRCLGKVFEAMAGDNSDDDGMDAWATELVELGARAGIEAPLYTPADWYRLAHFVLSCLPAETTSNHLGGFAHVHRYLFLECNHELHDLDNTTLVQCATASGTRSLLEGLASMRCLAQEVVVQCPFCGTVGRMTHAELPVARLAPSRPAPSTLWILLFRNDDTESQNLLRHAIDIPLRLGIDRDGVLASVCPDNTYTYTLYAVLLYFSKNEREDAVEEFDGDSGGRFSLAIYFGEKDGFYWAQDNRATQPLLGHDADIIKTHSHAVLYNKELS